MSEPTKGWKAEVLVQGEWARNSEVWPDEKSAWSAGCDLMRRWILVVDFRAVEVDEAPNRAVWELTPPLPDRVQL